MRWRDVLALAFGYTNRHGGGGATGMRVGFVNQDTTAFPTKRPDGTPLKTEDYVSVDASAILPFTIGSITFNSKRDTAVWTGGQWVLSAGAVIESNEVFLKQKTRESLSGAQTIQSATNIEFATMIGRQKSISVDDKADIIDALNYIWVECKKAGYTFTITETDSDSIRSIVFNVKDKDNNVLIDKTLNDIILKTRKVAGYDLADDITAQEIQDAIKDLTATLTNKSISADDNTITELETDNFKSGVILNVANTGTGGTDTTLLTEKAIIDLHNKAGHKLSLDLSGKVLTINLLDKNNNIIDTQTVDIEFIKSITWNDATSKLILTKSDNTTSEVELTKVVITDKTQTLTNKTIDAEDNTIEHLETDNFKSSALAKSTDNVRTYAESVDTKLATEKFLQKTLDNIETPTNNNDAVNKKYVDDEIQKVVDNTFTFKGFISTTEPTGNLKAGMLWYNANALPITFPINVKTYNGTEWSTETSEYTSAQFDTWSFGDNGYYWFGNAWNIIDTASSTVDNTTIDRNNLEQLEVKDGGITNAKLDTDVKVGSLAGLTTTDKSSVTSAINELNENKVETTDAVNKLYGTDENGEQKQYSTSEFGYLTDDTDYGSNPADTDKLANVDIATSKVKHITFANLWTWVLSKISGICEKGIQVASGKIGHTNNITANTTNGLKTLAYDSNGHITSATAKSLGRGISDSSNTIGHSNTAITAHTTNGVKTFAVDEYGHITGYTAKTLGRGLSDSSNVIGHSNIQITEATTQSLYPIKINDYGHITAYGTGQATSDTYKSGANNQILTRNGAYAMWKQATKMIGIFTRTSAQSFTANSWANISLTASNDVDTSYASLSSSGIKIAKTGIYNFQITIRMTDSITSDSLIEWAVGLTGHEDDQAGGCWYTSKHRHKVTTNIIAYITSGTTVYPRIYSTGGINQVNYCNVVASCIKES